MSDVVDAATKLVKRIAKDIEPDENAVNIEEKGDYLENSNIELAKDKDDYSINQQKAIEGYEEAVDLSLKDFINRNINGELKPNDTYSLKDVSPRASEDIKKAVGVDTTGFKTAVESRMITHILKGHGANGTTDHSMANIDDIARMQFVIDNYDNLEDGGKSSAYMEPYVFPSGEVRNRKARTVVYSKSVNGVYYVVEAVPDTKKKNAFIVSAYMSNKKRGAESSHKHADKHDITPSETSDTAEKPRAFESVNDAHPSSKIISSDNAAVNSYEGKNTPSEQQTITSQTETDNIGVKEKHRAMENGVLSTVVPEVSTSVSDAGNGVATETVASDSVVNTFYSRIADKILNEYLETGAVLDSKALVEIARDGGKSKSYFEPYVTASGVVKQHTAHTVIYSKKVNGIYYVVEALPDTKRKTAFVVSAYMTNKKRGTGSQMSSR